MIVAAAAFVISCASGATQAAIPDTLKPWHDPPPPGFSLPSVAGGAVALDSQRGQLVLVHFFATWCVPCKEELPALQRFVERAPKDSVRVLTISVAEVPLRVKRFLETSPLNLPMLLDEDRAVARAWSISALPSTVILDANLTPRLFAETDVAWDNVEPDDLMKMLKVTHTSSATNPTVGRMQ